MQQAAHEQSDDLWLVLPHLGPGGAQKVALLAAGFFIAKGWRVRLVTMLPGPAQAHAIPEGLLLTDLAPAVDVRWKRNHWKGPWLLLGLRFANSSGGGSCFASLHRTPCDGCFGGTSGAGATWSASLAIRLTALVR